MVVSGRKPLYWTCQQPGDLAASCPSSATRAGVLVNWAALEVQAPVKEVVRKGKANPSPVPTQVSEPGKPTEKGEANAATQETY